MTAGFAVMLLCSEMQLSSAWRCATSSFGPILVGHPVQPASCPRPQTHPNQLLLGLIKNLNSILPCSKLIEKPNLHRSWRAEAAVTSTGPEGNVFRYWAIEVEGHKCRPPSWVDGLSNESGLQGCGFMGLWLRFEGTDRIHGDGRRNLETQ